MLFSATKAAVALTCVALVSSPTSAARSRTKHSSGVALGSVHAFKDASPKELTLSESLPFVAIADLDANSKDANATKLAFFSYLQHGSLEIWTRPSDTEDVEAEIRVSWGEQEKATSSINDAGRGFELSELAWYQNKLLTVDDRTGIVFELTGFEDSAPLKAIPQNIVMEGNGVSGKGQKHEWATVKDDELYLGSNGIVLTDADGKTDHAREWVAVLNVNDDIRHVDWSANYQRVREALGIEDPGYVTHEAVEWSAIHKKWFLLPRRVSHEAFNETLDARRGANILIVASEDFEEIDIVEIGEENDAPERGFSSFKFVPGTDDYLVFAIRSVEMEEQQTAFVTLFSIDGDVVLDDVEIPGDAKYEGLAFTPM